jgi:hypothetical protein
VVAKYSISGQTAKSQPEFETLHLHLDLILHSMETQAVGRKKIQTKFFIVQYWTVHE